MSHSWWVIDYCFHAGEDYRVGDRGPWLPRRAQTAHLYPPDTQYWERVVGKPLVRKSAAMLFGLSSPQIMTPIIHPAHGYAEFEDPTQALGALLHQVAEVGHLRGAGGYWAAQGVLCRVLDLLFTSTPLTSPVFRYEPLGQEPADLASRVDAYLREHLPARLTLENIARAMKMSVSALSHGYKRQTGKAVMAAAMEMRLDTAKPLLLQGQRLKTIAATLGFSDAFHLSKQFKRQVGMSPREFVGRGVRHA